MRNELTSLAYQRSGETIEFDMTLEPMESVLLVFAAQKRTLPRRIEPGAVAKRTIPLNGTMTTMPVDSPVKDESGGVKQLDGCPWVWYPEGNPAAAAPPGTRYFRKPLDIPAERTVQSAQIVLSADNDFTLFVDGQEAGRSSGATDSWREPTTVDVSKFLHTGMNLLAIQAINTTDRPSPAGLIGRLVVTFNQGEPIRIMVDGTWKTANRAAPGWTDVTFDDRGWATAREVARFGQAPWGRLGGRDMTVSPITAAMVFSAPCELPTDLDLTHARVYLETDLPEPEAAARVTVNGTYAGGFIGGPYRLDLTKHLRPGTNRLRIEPFAPRSARLVIY
jgi:hypothetical protein